MKKIKIIIAVILLLALGYVGFSIFFPQSPASAPAIYTSSGLWYRSGNMLKTNPSLPITQGNQKTYATTTTTATLLNTELNGYSVISVTPNGASLTLTLPATSTLTTFVPNAGDNTTVFVRNATTTAGVNLTLAAGTGMTLKMATSTNALTPGSLAKLIFIRKTNTDMDVLINVNI